MNKSVKLKIRHTPQTEGHTCGFCAASSVYRHYGMDPGELGLREYLGTDNALPYGFPGRSRIEAWMGAPEAPGSGTYPMDMLAVLHWDGFDTVPLTGAYPRWRDRLRDNLSRGGPALAMLYDCLHWVVVSGMDESGVWIVDGYFVHRDVNGGSGRSHTYRLDHGRFDREQHGAILLSRDDGGREPLIRDMTRADFIREYARGVSWGAAALGKNIPRQIREQLRGLKGR